MRSFTTFGLFALGLFALGMPGSLNAQPAPKVEFEVATIKQAGPLQPQAVAAGKIHVGMTIDGSRVDMGFLSLAELIPMAYRLKPFQLSGPDWLSQNRFDILAKIPEGAATEQIPEMLQALLVERFKLAAHMENKEHAVYALIEGKGGVKLKPGVPDTEPPPADGSKPGISIGTTDGSRATMTMQGNGAVIRSAQAGTIRTTAGPDGVHFDASNMNMTTLAEMLSRFADRPVVDQTGLKGGYQLTLTIPMQQVLQMARAAGAVPAGAALPPGLADGASDPSGTIFSTVQEMGLKLDPRKTPVQTVIVDHVEKLPTEN
jgi:uncharacterized protein (TIGR03435 family)